MISIDSLLENTNCGEHYGDRVTGRIRGNTLNIEGASSHLSNQRKSPQEVSVEYTIPEDNLQPFGGDELIVNHPTIEKLSQHFSEPSEETENKNIVSKIGLKVLVKEDCILPDDIKGSGNVLKASQVGNILLTGGTGHLGVHILEQLSKLSSINVICLIRGPNYAYARQKLINTLKTQKLSFDINGVTVIIGDVAQEKFGLSVEEYNRLSESIDSVYHVAAKVNFVEDYRTLSPNRTDIRSANVLGTINVLRFACHGKTKRVFYASSIVSINKLNSDGFAYEEFPDDKNNAEGMAMGYALTKFVSEKLIGQAISRGIPCIVIRYPNVAGNSQTGHFNIGLDFGLNLFLIAIKLGCIYNSEGGLSLLSADMAAELTMDLLFNDNVDSEMYNLIQPNSISTQELANMVKSLGYNLQVVDLDVFFEKLFHDVDNNIEPLFKNIFSSDYLNQVISCNKFISKYFFTGTLNDRKLSQKVQMVVINIAERIGQSQDGFKSCLLHAQSLGMLK